MEQEIFNNLIGNSPWAALAGLALWQFLKYVKEKDSEKSDDKLRAEESYKDIISKYIERENRYIELISKFGDELTIVKDYIIKINKKLEESNR